MKLLQKFRRDESPLRTPTAIGTGVTVGPGGVWQFSGAITNNPHQFYRLRLAE